MGQLELALFVPHLALTVVYFVTLPDIPAVGNFSVQYNFQAISIALLVMSASVCTSNDDSCKDGEQSAWVSSTATATVFVGAITGQLSVSYRAL